LIVDLQNQDYSDYSELNRTLGESPQSWAQYYPNSKISRLIMIDEPEISMHPKWQQRILKYFKGLFVDNGNQIAQLFFATHSDHVVKDALQDTVNTVVLTLEDIGGNIQWRKNESPSVLPSITSAETNYLAFDLVTNDYHIELYGWLQDKESRNTVKSCDDFIIAQASYDPTIHRKPSSFGTTKHLYWWKCRGRKCFRK